jgi:hypothetical protein
MKRWRQPLRLTAWAVMLGLACTGQTSSRPVPDAKEAATAEVPPLELPPVCAPILATVAAAIAELDEDPPRFEIERVPHPIAYAYTALLRSARGDEPGSQQAIEQIPESLRRFARDFVQNCATCEDDAPGPNRTRWELALIRETTYWWGGNTCPQLSGLQARTWCGMFDRYPREAVATFIGCGGSGPAGEAGEQKEYCAQRLLASRGSAALGREAIGAVHSVIDSIQQLGPYPFVSSCVTTLMADAMQGPIFSPTDFIDRHFDDGDLNAEISAAGIFIRNLDAQLARVRRVAAKNAPTLAAAICKMAEHRQTSLTSEQCSKIAKTSTERALTIWLSGNPYAMPRVDAKGDLVEPKPWRAR